MENQSHNFQVDLGGVLELLSGYLYSSPDVFIRELIQNASDAIAERTRAGESFTHKIEFDVNETAGVITVIDNGIGLGDTEIREFLSRVGASIKRTGEADRSTFIGQFGVGILSCFMVADEIVILTRRAGSECSGLRWTASPDGTYRIDSLEREIDTGTRVILKLNDRGKVYAKPRVVERLIDRYAKYLGTPVTMSGDGWPLNESERPWARDLSAAETRDELIEEFGWSTGLKALDVVDLSDPEHGLEGIAYILPELPANAVAQTHEIYLKNIFVTDTPGDLLPRWSGFTRCVLSSDRLKPTASRESFTEDENYATVRRIVSARLRQYLADLAKRDRVRLALLLELQDFSFRQLAVENDEFFDSVIDLLSFESSLGRITFQDFRREHTIVRTTQTDDQFKSVAALAAARGMIVFNGGYTNHSALLEKAVARDPSLTLETLDGRDLVEELGAPSAADSERFDKIRNAIADVLEPFAVLPRLARFEPSDLPSVYAESADSNLARSLRAARETSQGLWVEVLDAAAPDLKPEDEFAVLCFNASNPVIRGLLVSQDIELARETAILLYVQALLLSQQPLTTDETSGFSNALARVLAKANKATNDDTSS